MIVEFRIAADPKRATVVAVCVDEGGLSLYLIHETRTLERAIRWCEEWAEDRNIVAVPASSSKPCSNVLLRCRIGYSFDLYGPYNEIRT